MKAARISGGRIVEVFGHDVAGMADKLHASVLATLVDVPDTAVPGDWLDGPPPAAAPTIDDYTLALQEHIEAVARARGYDGALALASYKDSTQAGWAAEASVFIAWRDAVWLAAYATMAAVQGGQQAAPTIEGLIGGLPQVVWP